jgi:hypothetical protein
MARIISENPKRLQSVMHRDANLYISFIAILAPLQIYAKALNVSSHFAIGCICNRHFVPTDPPCKADFAAALPFP